MADPIWFHSMIQWRAVTLLLVPLIPGPLKAMYEIKSAWSAERSAIVWVNSSLFLPHLETISLSSVIGAVVLAVALSNTRSTETWRSSGGARNAELTEAGLVTCNLHPWEKKLPQIQPFSRDQKRHLCKLNGQRLAKCLEFKTGMDSPRLPSPKFSRELSAWMYKNEINLYSAATILYHT